MSNWSILYRGPVSSCNYACRYCPFAKTRNTAAQLRDDAEKLARFIGWVRGRGERIGILFTPWGEALHHLSYQRAIVELSRMPHVRRVAIQTNLAAPLDWLRHAEPGKTALWTTYHPTQTTRTRFLAQTRRLDELCIAYSVGVVGFNEQLGEIQALRQELPADTYLWVNALKRRPHYYGEDDLAAFTAIDPLFPLNATRHLSRGKACHAGHTAFTVDGEGDVRRCHFIKNVIGNIYRPDFERVLAPSPCTNTTCGCHIGYVHLEELDLYSAFGEGILERIPKAKPPVAPMELTPAHS